MTTSHPDLVVGLVTGDPGGAKQPAHLQFRDRPWGQENVSQCGIDLGLWVSAGQALACPTTGFGSHEALSQGLADPLPFPLNGEDKDRYLSGGNPNPLPLGHETMRHVPATYPNTRSDQPTG